MADAPGSRGVPFPDLDISAFLYGHQGPWPQPSRDHPFGLAPAVYNIPQEEWTDWQQYVGSYYLKNATEFGVPAGIAAVADAVENDLGYPELSDADFSRLVSEGLFSKFLSKLDPHDLAVFQNFITDTDTYEYVKADYSCMRVVKKLHPGEAAAASVTLIRKRKDDTDLNWEVVALQLQHWEPDPKTPDSGRFVESEVFTPADGEAWRIARYFVLQGALHRINLIDHTEVHFPPDTINAITKTVLPTDNLVFKLLQPHLWLSLCVNNTVLEGQRSLINRDTWYPWSPFVAKGAEVRKLLPFGWWGSDYYASRDPYFQNPNSSYPAYRYGSTPPEPAIPSKYTMFLWWYFRPIQNFTRGVIAKMGDTDWLEVGYWADHIAIWLPGFPSSADLGIGTAGTAPNTNLLADVLAHFIWNASVRHSADHQTLHEMVVGRKDADGKLVTSPLPVPFILRVNPPLTKNYTRTMVDVDPSALSWIEQGERVVEKLRAKPPLCWPGDPTSARWADLLFYMPHNSCRLIDLTTSKNGDPARCYRFDTPALQDLVNTLHDELHEVDRFFDKDGWHFVPLEDIASSIQY